jgi:hypothetical protein
MGLKEHCAGADGKLVCLCFDGSGIVIVITFFSSVKGENQAISRKSEMVAYVFFKFLSRGFEWMLAIETDDVV